MSSSNHLIDDIARVASGALGAIGGVRDEFETKLRDILKRFLDEMDYVTREEFEVARDLAQKAREENERLEERIKSLEEGLQSTNSGQVD